MQEAQPLAGTTNFGCLSRHNPIRSSFLRFSASLKRADALVPPASGILFTPVDVLEDPGSDADACLLTTGTESLGPYGFLVGPYHLYPLYWDGMLHFAEDQDGHGFPCLEDRVVEFRVGERTPRSGMIEIRGCTSPQTE